MKRKVLTTVLSTALCVSMLGTTCLAADTPKELDTSGTKIEGESGIKSPVYKVVVPTSLNFAIDPFQQASPSGSQISSADFYVYNKSNVAVRVAASVQLIPKDDNVKLQDDASKVTETDTTKKIYMALEVPTTVTVTLDTAAAPTDSTSTTDIAGYFKHSDGKLYLKTGITAEEQDDGQPFHDATEATTADITCQEIKSKTVTYEADIADAHTVTLGTDPVTVAFALKGAAYHKVYANSGDTVGEDKFYNAADATDGATAFRFTGTVNSRATWAEKDIKAEVTYDFLGIKDSNYTTQTLDKEEATDNPNIAYIEGAAKLLDERTNVLESDGNNDIVIYYTGSKPSSFTITPVNTTGSAKSAWEKTATEGQVIIDNQKVTILAAWLTSLKASSKGSGTFKVTINSVDYTVKW